MSRWLRVVEYGGAALATAIGGAGAYGAYLARQDDVHDYTLATAPMPETKAAGIELRRDRVSCMWHYTATHSEYALSYDIFRNKNSLSQPTRGDRTVAFISPPSFVASRAMWLPLADCLSDRFTVTEVAGYGLNRQMLKASQLTPQAAESAIEAMLEDLKRREKDQAPNVVVSGHAALYCLNVARRRPELMNKLVLVNPTYTGPLPSAAAEKQQLNQSTSMIDFARSLSWTLAKIPIVANFMVLTGTSAASIRKQLESHVYTDRASITDEAVAHQQAIARAGAPLPKFAFLTGRMDPYGSPAQLDSVLKSGIDVPVMVIMATGGPHKSREDVHPFEKNGFPFVWTSGALRSFEEHPKEVAKHILPFFEEKPEPVSTPTPDTEPAPVAESTLSSVTASDAVMVQSAAQE